MDNSKKEIYFTKDIYREVSKRLGLKETIIAPIFESYLEQLKEDIENGDEIMYRIMYLGKLIIPLEEAERQVERYKKRYTRETDEIEKEKILATLNNYRIRVKKIKIELEKMKKPQGYMYRSKRANFKATKYAYTKPETYKRKDLFRGYSFSEVVEKQNAYAYNYYKKLGKPVE